MNCNQCGTEVPEGSAFCTKCGARIAPQNVPPPQPPGYAAMPNPANELPPAPPYAHATQPVYTGARRTSGMAIASLVLGIASFLFDWLLLIPSLLGLIFGIVAVVQIGRNPGMGGKAMAIIGIILSVVAALIWLLLGAALAALIPWSNEIYWG